MASAPTPPWSLGLNGHNQTVGSLAVISTGTVNGIFNTFSSAATLTINGSATTTDSSVIGVPTNAGTATLLAGANNNVSLTLASTNTGTQTLGGGTLIPSTSGQRHGPL